MMILQAGLANVNHEVSNDELLAFLMENLHDAEFKKISFRAGSIAAASIDWQAIINTGASIITVAQVLWQAYKKFIRPLKKEGDFKPFLFISVRNKKNEYTQFSVGDNYMNEQEFISDFTETIEKIGINNDTNSTYFETRITRQVDKWKIK